MNEWLKISALLCIFGFLKELRPSEPFIFVYLTGPYWNMTKEEVLQDVFPISIYGYLALLVVVFLITDLCRYKPLIIVLGLSGVIVWSLLIWGSTLLELQILEVAYGTFMATEVAYYTYIYAKVPKEYYPQVTAHTRAAILAGRCISGASAQLLIEFQVLDYKGLNYINLSSSSLATVWALFLPSVATSIYFHQDLQDKAPKAKGKYKSAFNLMKIHFCQSFSKQYVVKWSIWWALATAGYNQLQAYMQPLWSEIHGTDTTSLHNGTVEAILTLVGCAGAISTGFLKINWERRRDVFLSICSLISGVLLLISSQTNYIVISYICYIIFGGIYHFVIAVAASEVAKYILEDSYGLVFGLNTLIALIIQTLATLILVSGSFGLALPPRPQHVAYGIYYLIIAVLFIIIKIVSCVKDKK